MAIFKVDLGTPIPRGIRWATGYAALSEHPVHRVGAILVAGGRLHCGGFNKNRSHPQSPHEFCIHAEVDVLLRDRYPMENGYEMYIVRLTKGNAMGTSKPCPKCRIYIKEANCVKSITYIDEKGEVKTEEL